MEVFPAYAGVILVDKSSAVTGESVPRVCGGDPINRDKVTFTSRCSPRMRG